MNFSTTRKVLLVPRARSVSRFSLRAWIAPLKRGSRFHCDPPPVLQYWAKNPVKDFPNYTAGTWGPSAGDALLEMDGRKWRKL